jgi:hypothetical protein
MSTYDPAFFKYINNGSTSSAAAIIPLIKLYFNVQRFPKPSSLAATEIDDDGRNGAHEKF